MQRALQTRHSKKIGGGMGLLRGRLGGVATFESPREELEEKRELKRLAFSAGETAIVPSAQKRGGKPDLQKFL